MSNTERIELKHFCFETVSANLGKGSSLEKLVEASDLLYTWFTADLNYLYTSDINDISDNANISMDKSK
jgi:hypothetical protein